MLSWVFYVKFVSQLYRTFYLQFCRYFLQILSDRKQVTEGILLYFIFGHCFAAVVILWYHTETHNESYWLLQSL